MTRTPAERYLLVWLWILILSLTTAVIALAVLAPRAQRPLYYPADQRWIDRANRDAAGQVPEEIRRRTFPIVMRLSQQVCVELRSTLRDGAGTYLVCYDQATGRPVEERLKGPTFP